MDSTHEQARALRVSRRVVSAGAWAIRVQAATVGAGGVVSLLALARGRAADASAAIALGVMGLSAAVALMVVAHGLARGARWPRSAALTWQVIETAVGLGALPQNVWVGIALLVPVPLVLAGIWASANQGNGHTG